MAEEMTSLSTIESLLSVAAFDCNSMVTSGSDSVIFVDVSAEVFLPFSTKGEDFDCDSMAASGSDSDADSTGDNVSAFSSDVTGSESPSTSGLGVTFVDGSVKVLLLFSANGENLLECSELESDTSLGLFLEKL